MQKNIVWACFLSCKNRPCNAGSFKHGLTSLSSASSFCSSPKTYWFFWNRWIYAADYSGAGISLTVWSFSVILQPARCFLWLIFLIFIPDRLTCVPALGSPSPMSLDFALCSCAQLVVYVQKMSVRGNTVNRGARKTLLLLFYNVVTLITLFLHYLLAHRWCDWRKENFPLVMSDRMLKCWCWPKETYYQSLQTWSLLRAQTNVAGAILWFLCVRSQTLCVKRMDL